MARERNEARLMEALMSQQPDPFAAILAWEDDRPFPRDFRLAAECSKRAGVLAMMADMRSDEAMRTQAFAALLRAMVLSDSRIGAMGHTLQALRLPEAFFHVTKDFAFTGEMCASMLADVGCKWVVLGHSERRHGYHGETSAQVAMFLSLIHI